MKTNERLWTGKTPRQELVDVMTVAAAVHGFTVNDALEHALDGAERAPDTSMKREMLRWWDDASANAQTRLLREVRRAVKADDRLMGRNNMCR